MTNVTRPLVSVVIPTRDRATEVVGAVRSALAQTYPRIEVWVVDDGSSPSVRLPPELEADRRVRLVHLPQHLGPSVARNEGVAQATGPLVAFLDDDDEWFPEKVAEQVEALGSDESIGAIDCGYELWDGHRVLLRFVPRRERDVRRHLLEHPTMTSSAVLVRRVALEEIGGFDPVLDRGQDWELWVRLTDRYRVLSVPKVLFRKRPSRATPASNLRGYREVVRRLASRIDRLPPRARARIRAGHRFNEGVYLAKAGRSRDARTALWKAWREHPRSIRPLVHLPRTVVGERAWGWVARLGHLARRYGSRVLGRDPVLRRW